MILLGLDTSGKTASAAIFDTDAEVFLAQNTVYAKQTHSQVVMPMVEDALRQAGLKLSQIDAAAVAKGPGSYTGLRIGVAAVKALSFGLDIKCCGVSTLMGLAYSNTAFSGHICAVMKARADKVYTCTFDCDGYGASALTDERIITCDELAMELAMDGSQVLLCGDYAAEMFTQYRSPMFRIAPPQSRLQNACGICLAAMASGNFIAPESLEVAYLQKVKAEKDLEDKMK